MAFYDAISVETVGDPARAQRLVPGGGTPPDPGPPPVITWLSPTPGSPIYRTQPIVVKVTDSDLVLCVLSVRFELSGLEEVVFRRGSFSTLYAKSTVVQNGQDLVFTLRRSRGWPMIRSAVAGLHERAIFAVDAVDAEGQVG